MVSYNPLKFEKISEEIFEFKFNYRPCLEEFPPYHPDDYKTCDRYKSRIQIKCEPSYDLIGVMEIMAADYSYSSVMCFPRISEFRGEYFFQFSERNYDIITHIRLENVKDVYIEVNNQKIDNIPQISPGIYQLRDAIPISKLTYCQVSIFFKYVDDSDKNYLDNSKTKKISYIKHFLPDKESQKIRKNKIHFKLNGQSYGAADGVMKSIN